MAYCFLLRHHTFSSLAALGICILHWALTKCCFSFRDIGQFFPEVSAFGGRHIPDPESGSFRTELSVHLLQQHQQPLPDVPGSYGRLHLEWTQW